MKKIIAFCIFPFLAIGQGESHYLKAKAYEKQGDFSSAITEYKKALQSDPSSIFLKRSLALAYLYNQEEDLALSLFLEIVKISQDPQDWRTIGNIYVKSKRYKTAIEAYNRGLKIKEDRDLLYDLAEGYLLAKQTEDAIAIYKRIISLFPQEESALLSLGLIYENRGKTKEAKEIYERLLSINKENVFAMKRLILIYLNEEVKLAESLAYKLLEKEQSPHVFLLLGFVLEKNRKDKEAERCYKNVVDASFKEGFIRLGWLLLKNERDDEALKLIEDGLEKFPGEFELLVLYGVLLSQKREYQKAISIFKELIKKSPKDDYLYFQLAVAYDGLLNKDFAIKYLYKAIRLNPKNSSAYNYIGYTWADSGKNLKRALRLIEKALEIEPDNPAYIDSLAWCYYKMGDIDLALSFLLKAQSLSKDKPDPVILEHLGDIYYDKGIKEKAGDFWRLSLEKFKEERDKERLLKKLRTNPIMR